MKPPSDVVDRILRLPQGSSLGHADDKAFVTSCTHHCGGQAIKVVAHERGGSDYISLNLYLLKTGPRLFPCEMPVEKVIAFVRAFKPTPAPPN